MEEVIIEPLEACRVRRVTLWAVQEKTESDQSSLYSGVARHPIVLDGNGIRGQRESDDCDATGRPDHRPIGDQAIGGVICAQKIAKRRVLKAIEQVVAR
jgi:hypothetical protein